MTKSRVQFNLSAEPDGYGFYYGQAQMGDDVCQVNVLPPADQWDGDIKLEGYEPDEKAWIIYADSEEIARVESREDIAMAVCQRLAP